MYSEDYSTRPRESPQRLSFLSDLNLGRIGSRHGSFERSRGERIWMRPLGSLIEMVFGTLCRFRPSELILPRVDDDCVICDQWVGSTSQGESIHCSAGQGSQAAASGDT